MKNGLVKAIVATTMSVIIGCASSRPYATGGKNYTPVRNFKLEKIDETNSRYQAKGLELKFMVKEKGREEIVKEKYFVTKTDLGIAMFKEEKSIRANAYTIEKGKIKGTTSIQSGEGGLFFLERYANWVQLKNRVIINEPKIIQKKGNLGIFHTTEQDSLFYMAIVELPGKGPCYIVQVEDSEMNKKKLYNFYVSSANNSKIKIIKINQEGRKEGKMILENRNQILRPKFKCWKQIDEAISKLKPMERERAKKGFKYMGMPQAEKTGNLN